MELDLDISDLGEVELPERQSESQLWIGERIVPSFPLEPGIPRDLSCFDPSEERFKGQIYPFLDVLEGLREYLLLVLVCFSSTLAASCESHTYSTFQLFPLGIIYVI
jgi:hypothetical protein